MRNLYSPGAGTPPPLLAGRDRELAEIDVAMQRLSLGRSAKSLLLTGLHGVGKTVLLREFGRTAERRGWVRQHIEATEALQFPQEAAALVRQALLRMSTGERLKRQAHQALGILKSFQLSWRAPDMGDLTFSLQPLPGQADSGLLGRDLGDLLVALGEVAQAHRTGVLLAIDEIQFLPAEHLAALMVGLHRVSQEQLPLLAVGAGLPSLPGLVGEAKTYAERLFSFRVINSLQRDAARAALTRPAAQEQVLWRADALDLIVSQTRGYPYFLQEFGRQAWNLAIGPNEITIADAKKAIPAATSELDAGFFRVRVDRTSDAQRAYLAAMASLGTGPYAYAAVDDALGEASREASRAAGPHRDTLIKRGLCYSPRHGLIDFTVPMFDEFMRRFH